MDQPLPAGPHRVSSLATSFIAVRSLRHPPDALLLRMLQRIRLYKSCPLIPASQQQSATLVFSFSCRSKNSVPAPEGAKPCPCQTNSTHSIPRADPKIRPDRLQKGGVPAAPSGTATLLRLSPSRRVYPCPVVTPNFRSPQLPWLDGRCVQGPGTYSPRHG